MWRATGRLASVLDATIDLLLATLGVGIVLAPLVTTWGPVLGVPSTLEQPAIGALALAGSYPFVVRRWWLGHLGEYVFLFVLCLLGLGFLVAVPLVATGTGFASTNPWPRALLVTGAHAVALALLHRRHPSLRPPTPAAG